MKHTVGDYVGAGQGTVPGMVDFDAAAAIDEYAVDDLAIDGGDVGAMDGEQLAAVTLFLVRWN